LNPGGRCYSSPLPEQKPKN
jgi:hypothetical protein